MTNERKPSSTQYKQVYYAFAKGAKYTSCMMGESDYLQTEVWKELRDRALMRDNYQCKICHTAKNVEVHHRVYPEVWGEELLDDLVTLCAYHHGDVHSFDHNN